MGDGTFGRCLEVVNLTDKDTYALKIIRAVPKYVEAAKLEAEMYNEI